MPERCDAGGGLSGRDGGLSPPDGPERASLALPRTHRLTSAQYRRVFDHGRRIVGRFLVMWWLDGTGSGARIGVVASRRSFRRAVDRNRARRLSREAFRCSQGSLRPDVDLILVSRVAVGGQSLATVEKEFRHLCRRAGLWKTK